MENEVFIGTKSIIGSGKPGFGILKTAVGNTSSFEKIHPPGPLMNSMFSIKTPPNEIWAVFGGYSSVFNFNGGLPKSGISHYKNETWINTPYDTIAAIIPEPDYLSHIAVNPFNTEQVYISSYWAGLIEFNQGQAVSLYNQTNSTIVPFVGNMHLTLGSNYDRTGALWVMAGRVPKPLNKFENGQWKSYDFMPIIDPPTSNIGFTAPVFDEITITLDPKYYQGKEFKITTKNNSAENMYIQSASLNGQNLETYWFTHTEYQKGGQLNLVLGPKPNKDWGKE